MRRLLAVAAWLLAGAFIPEAGEGQDPPAAGATINVFLDCQNLDCDFDHLRREIEFVNWVRVREEAQIHVLGVSQQTGGGGEEVTLVFIGRGDFDGRTDTLQFRTRVTDTEDEQREALTNRLALGLIPFVTRTAVADRIRFRYERPDDDAPRAGVRDPWNLWVFEISAGASLEGERYERQREFNGEIEANRVTEAFKVFFSLEGSYEHSEQDDLEGNVVVETIVNTQKTLEAFAEAVWSLGPRWSFGVLADAQQSTFENYDLAIESGPGIEFSVFPYTESTRRSITFQYVAGIGAYNYAEITSLNRLREVRPLHQLGVDVTVQQPWGSIGGGIEARQFLHDLALHRVDVNGDLSLRLWRGLALNVELNFARVHDQINLPLRELSEEDILLGRRLRATDYEYGTFISFSYTFGSIFNNIVNPRF